MSIIAILFITLGFFTAAIINYLADVLPVDRKLTHPLCLVCHHPYKFIPYLLYSKCPSCGRKRSKRSWFVLVFTPIIFLHFWLFPPARLEYWMAVLVFSYLFLVVIIDIEHRLILHNVSLFGILIAIPSGIILHGIIPTLLGGLAGLGIMYVLYLLGIGFIHLLRIIKKKPVNETALGFGDVSLGFQLGIILGYPGIIAGIIFAILLGGLFSLLYLVTMLVFRRYKPLTALPYAPFLAISALILLFR